MGVMSAVKAARLANVDPRTMRVWVRRGLVPRLGFEACGRVFVRQEVLQELISGKLQPNDTDQRGGG